ncbi:TIGR03668 family PPOX class F420-dependent oxidoreductase [Mycobacterium sp. CVI_P3]|uniref:TIGR03668 family PPOX class F420-dependent oxidoreductase n=1 Tax=Mycobacterium pinniadriaticum TaxID=2994102 RepID=A0ABT3SJA7_9MYCO|nr:TIGR03668 family PPOX class F420-dependent oxidoreductase [Mycobacterium pinniadriaticum]MCX2933192.1 TIGR03668 family PPOX class F420-dependent oxidoreductase [Mycobacterium pinniadriaticum]MCX2939614.1 TIGR03668 family PPOX class F420-dependent oxidoreductase [Mycobacterium pinniadriaticum]
MSGPAQRFAAAKVARLATFTPDGPPHLVPIVFAVAASVVYTAVDGKPKSSHRLRRLANIEANPRVCILVDHYDDDWSQLWWIRADGIATIHHDGSMCDRGRALLRAKYPQYQSVRLDGPVITVDVDRWSSWSG